ncbi:ATP-dependent helicase/deoxyribonuclease subunit B [compost metagenome]
MTAEQAGLEMLKRFKMRGLLLADRDVIAKMDHALDKGYSDILPVAVKADGGFYSSASVATEQQWHTLLHSARHAVTEIGTRITDGDVQITPYRLGTETACTYCAFMPLCRFEESIEGSSYHVLSKPGKDKLWELLEQSVEEGER